jgi:hypothetical protein
MLSQSSACIGGSASRGELPKDVEWVLIADP